MSQTISLDVLFPSWTEKARRLWSVRRGSRSLVQEDGVRTKTENCDTGGTTDQFLLQNISILGRGQGAGPPGPLLFPPLLAQTWEWRTAPFLPVKLKNSSGPCLCGICRKTCSNFTECRGCNSTNPFIISMYTQRDIFILLFLSFLFFHSLHDFCWLLLRLLPVIGRNFQFQWPCAGWE